MLFGAGPEKGYRRLVAVLDVGQNNEFCRNQTEYASHLVGHEGNARDYSGKVPNLLRRGSQIRKAEVIAICPRYN